MKIPFFSLNPPDWYAQAQQSGAIKEITKETSIFGYIPYQRARQIAIISGLVEGILIASDGPEKISVALVTITATAASFLLYWQFGQSKPEIMRIHQKLIAESSGNQ